MRPSPRRFRPFSAAMISGAMALAVLAVLGGFLWFLHQAAAPRFLASESEPHPPTPGIAVLTGGPDRVETGLSLLAAWPQARLIVSGVGPDSGLADLAREAGMDPAPLAARVALGHRATSTRGNAREVAAWARDAGLREIAVVTAGFHMPRALLELRRSLPEATLRPHPVAPFVARPLPMLREYAKLVGAAFGLSALTEKPSPDRVLPDRVPPDRPGPDRPEAGRAHQEMSRSAPAAPAATLPGPPRAEPVSIQTSPTDQPGGAAR